MNPAPDWMDQARGLVDMLKQGLAAPAGADPDADKAHASDCRWCPLCQAAAVLRGERPEVTAAIADVLTATATALRSFAEQVTPAEDTEPPAPAGPGDPPPVVQQIDIA